MRVSRRDPEQPVTVCYRRDLEPSQGSAIVPVQGVVRSQLRDTYAESRGDHAHEALDILAERGTPVLSGRFILLFGILRGNPDLSWSRGTPVNPYRLLVPAEPMGFSLQLRL